MDDKALVIWDPALVGYDFGEGHPMNPLRLALTAKLAEGLGVLEHVRIEAPSLPDESDAFLETVHSREYLDAVRAASQKPASADQNFGIGTEDDPAFAGMHDVSALIAAGTLQAVQAVHSGEARHAVNFTGGLHHAMPDKASGFCIYNDAAVGIQWLLDQGVERVAYVDIDVHHGDGVEKVFWNDPRVLTISIHESGTVLFPGTGFARDIGGPDAEGSAVNISLPPGTGDSDWLRALHAVVHPVVTAFKPQFMVTQHGCDSHYSDPLAHMVLTVDAQKMAHRSLHELAHDVCDGRWVALGGGGYELVDVVPRSWTHLTAIAADRPISLETETPDEWRAHVEEITGRTAPSRMGDGVAEKDDVWFQSWASGMHPESTVDQAVMATREAVFPLHGLDVWFD